MQGLPKLNAKQKPGAALRLTRQAQLAIVGGLLGAVAFFLLYGFAPLNPINDTWLRGGYVERDLVQHYAGWLFYRQAQPAFPLAVAGNINVPYGAYIGLADSIPLFAVIFKPFAAFLPATFQYFGLWGLFCSVLQGVSAALLLGLFCKTPFYNATLCLLFLFSPIFLDRQLRHGALGAQWLILFSLYLYFKHRRSGKFFSAGFLLLSALSIGVHPYFTPMIFAVLFALLLQNGAEAKTWKKPLAMLCACLAAGLFTGFALGVFKDPANSGSTPYGYFSMNLNAVFNPQSRGYNWSLFLPAQNQVLGNYDGFNYLGVAVLLVLLGCAIGGAINIKKCSFLPNLKRHWALLFVCFCLFVFAVSNQVSANGRVLFYLPLPKAILQLCGVFRSSGRMFYPVWYLALLLACVQVLRMGKGKWRSAAICVFAAVQLLDTSPALLQKYKDFRPYTPMPSPLASPFWQQIGGNVKRIASLDDEGLYSGMDLALYAADNKMQSDDAFTARFNTAQREAQKQQNLALLTSGNAPKDTIFISSVQATFLNLAEGLQKNYYCALVDEHWFVFMPYSDDFLAYSGKDALGIELYPLLISAHTDALWDRGVLRTDTRVVMFEDSVFAQNRLKKDGVILAQGLQYQILDVSYKDAGWIMLTLDKDGTALQNTALEVLP